MAREALTPDPDRLSPQLAAWCAEAPAEERRTAIVRAAFSTDLAAAVRDLEVSGAEVESSGPGAITVVFSPPALARVSRLPWVLAVEPPRRLFPRLPGLR